MQELFLCVNKQEELDYRPNSYAAAVHPSFRGSLALARSYSNAPPQQNRQPRWRIVGEALLLSERLDSFDEMISSELSQLTASSREKFS